MAAPATATAAKIRGSSWRLFDGSLELFEWELAMSDMVVVERDDMDRLVLMRMDLDRYEAQLIPDLQQERLALYHALGRLVEAVREAEHLLKLEATTSHRGALHPAERLLVDLEQRREEPTGGQRRRDARRE
jgi:hypothetical protein